jgi:hypothetical protein
MITTFKTMLMSSMRWRIIGVLLMAISVAACNALKATYKQGDHVAYWWLDGYVDIHKGQAPQVREAIAQWFRWHRSEELPQYALLLQKAEQQAREPITGDAVCALVAEARTRGRVALDHALPSITAFVRTMTPDQVQHMELKFQKLNEKFRKENLPANPQERREAAYKRLRDRAEMMYGSLGSAQRDWLLKSVAMSPYDPERWNAERLARQQDIVNTVRMVIASPPIPQPQAQVLVAGLAERLQQSPRAEYRQYVQQLTDYNCKLVAQLHNGATPAQRLHARNKLKGWEDDVRSVLASGPG